MSEKGNWVIIPISLGVFLLAKLILGAIVIDWILRAAYAACIAAIFMGSYFLVMYINNKVQQRKSSKRIQQGG